MRVSAFALLAAVVAVGVLPTSSFAQTQRLLPTVNKIDLGSGVVTELSPYAGDIAPPLGVRVAVGDIDGDGLPDLITCPIHRASALGHDLEARKGWDGTIKGTTGLAPDLDTNFRLGFTATGTYADGTSKVRTAVATGGYVGGSGPLQVASWSWGVSNGSGATGLTDERTITFPSLTSIGRATVCVDPTCRDGFGIVVGTQQQQPGTTNKTGHVTLMKRGGETSNDFVACANTLGGGIQVAAGDLNGDGVAEIVVMARDQYGNAGRTAEGFTVSVFNRDGTLDLTMPWHPTVDASVAPDGEMTGRLCIGDVNRDGAPDILMTAATAAGPTCSVFSLTTPDASGIGTWAKRSEAELSLSGIKIDQASKAFCTLDPSFTTLSLDAPLAPQVQGAPSGGTLVLGMEVVPEPTTIGVVAAAMIGLARRRRA